MSKAAEVTPQIIEAVISQLKEPRATDPVQEAERCYRRGRTHYERRDMHTAVHLFRARASWIKNVPNTITIWG